MALGTSVASAASLGVSVDGLSDRFNAVARSLDIHSQMKLVECNRAGKIRACTHQISGTGTALAEAADHETVNELTLMFGRAPDFVSIRAVVLITMALFAPMSSADQRRMALDELMQTLTSEHRHRETVLDNFKWILLSNPSAGVWVVLRRAN